MVKQLLMSRDPILTPYSPTRKEASLRFCEALPWRSLFGVLGRISFCGGRWGIGSHKHNLTCNAK